MHLIYHKKEHGVKSEVTSGYFESQKDHINSLGISGVLFLTIKIITSLKCTYQ